MCDPSGQGVHSLHAQLLALLCPAQPGSTYFTQSQSYLGRVWTSIARSQQDMSTQSTSFPITLLGGWLCLLAV